MALGSPSPSSSTTTVSGTASASSTSATASSTGDSKPSGFFSANGTPALILAFLAIGLFVGGMLAMFGLRRRMVANGRRRWWLGNHATEALSDPWALEPPEPFAGNRSARRRKREVGTPPELWDVCASANISQSSSWAEIMPFSARIVREQAFQQQDERNHSTFIPRRAEVGLLPRAYADPFGFFHRAQATPAVVPVAHSAPPGRLQIAVVIAMPNPTHSQSESLDYTLGLTATPWNTDFALLDGAGPSALPP